ncbi:MAG: SRPBCC family protein [Acidobacteriota bacterium]|nr:SRPBCC family protein [Acidobacteriota bacterium]
MKFVKESIIKAKPERVFAFHALPDAIERLIPPWENARIIQKADITKVGSQAIIEQKIFGLIPSRWIAEHTKYEPPRMFEDIQISGPFRRWRHRHIISPHAAGAILRDEIEFEPPFSFFGQIAAPIFILPKIEKMFAYRHEVTRKWCEQNDVD